MTRCRTSITLDSNNIDRPGHVHVTSPHKLEEGSKIKLIINDSEHVDFFWGEYYAIGTPAYWIDQTKRLNRRINFSLGNSLSEEVIRCILGGHGIPAEIGDAAFHSLRNSGILCSSSSFSVKNIETLLRKPLKITGGKYPIFYRFPIQKSKWISAALDILKRNTPPTHPLVLRDWLMKIPGIGFKTASWIVRNYSGADCVAIIDIHIKRAGVAAGFFKESWRLPKDYSVFEKAFLLYAKLGNVSSSALDACIWGQMHAFGRYASSLLPQKQTTCVAEQ